MQRIYLDNNATTIVAPEVLEVMLEELSGLPANPSSVHFFGKEAKKKLTTARASIASYLKVKPTEIVFTSGATEGINTILRGQRHTHIVTSNVEHSCIYNTLKDLEKKGIKVTYLEAQSYGATTPDAVRLAITPQTTLIILGAVNNETGVKIDIEAIAKIALEARIPFALDGVALLGKEAFTIPEGVSAMAFSGHKIHGPKGIGFNFIRSNFKLSPLITGGDQEFSKRAGTENLAGILGLAKAIELLEKSPPMQKMQDLRAHFEKRLKELFSNVLINGDGPRICNTSNVSFLGVDGETLLIQLDQAGIAASHGSACASGSLEPSRILLSMNLPRERIKSSLRFSLSRFTTEQEIEQTISTIAALTPS